MSSLDMVTLPAIVPTTIFKEILYNAAVNGFINEMSAKVFEVPVNPRAAAIYGASKTVIMSSVMLASAYGAAKLGVKIARPMLDMQLSKPLIGVKLGLQAWELYGGATRLGVIASIPVAFVVGVVAGQHLTNLVYTRAPLSWRDVILLESLQSLGRTILNV